MSPAPPPTGTDPSSHAGHGGEEPTGSDAPLADAPLEAALLTVADLPEGYVTAEGHHGDGAEHAVSEVADESCHAFAALLVGGHGVDTARADASFTRSHLGPTVTQAVVAYDNAEAA
jgi:hypothetical protein